MKLRHSLLLLLSLCAVVATLLFRSRTKSTNEGFPEGSFPTNAIAPNTGFSTFQGISIPPPSGKTKTEVMKEALAAYNDQEIVFYGRVIDQTGEPVSGAKVKGTIQINNGVEVGADRIELNSDTNGLFTITGHTGKSLAVAILKEGHVIATTNTRFIYSRLWPERERFIPDKSNPVVFKMWKLRGADKLVPIDQRFRLHLSEFPASFDILTGKLVSTGGDIRLQLTRSQGEVSERTLQDWSVRVEALGGGLIETDPAAARVVYELPTSGYLPAYTYTMSAEKHTWQGALTRMFYVRTREGNLYAKLNLQVLINHHPEDTVRVDLRGELNPSGSPNFEADAAAMVPH